MKRLHTQESCPYCKGAGYFQLIVGGTEDCPACEGQGRTDHESPSQA
ncbi:YuiA family protein [Brevibacillus dissolubilis]|nr:YuiA family protein [Brevibacillus dissolubilis]